MNNTLAALRERKVVAIVRGIPRSSVVDLARALLAGGVSCIEVTYDQSSPSPDETLGSIADLAQTLAGEMLVGAGTVMSPEQVREAAKAGAQYIISPNADAEVIGETKRLGLVSMPGALTPTEIAAAAKAGADMVKVFPVSQLGPDYIKAVRGPLSHIPLVAVGGVNAANLASFLKAGAVGAGVGGNLVSKSLVAAGKFGEITAAAREYAEALREAEA